MKQYSVRRYETKDYQIWNDFIGQAKNATFLFHRDFMEYHADRFEDFSLLVFNEKEVLVAVLPANKVEDTVFSHQGLTYGGLVIVENMKLSVGLNVFQKVLHYLNDNAITELELKIIPSIYCSFFSEEINYALFLTNAKLLRCDCLSVIDLRKLYTISKKRKESIRRGKKCGLHIVEEVNFPLFWNEILLPNLEHKHHAKPVHTVEEITKLQKIFPDNIRHFNVYHNDKIVAGTTMFLTKNVAKPQYISGNEDRNQLGSIDFLYDFLLTKFKDKLYFDFGPSHENHSKNIKKGILFWKESFGAKTVTQSFYSVKTENYSRLENILL